CDCLRNPLRRQKLHRSQPDRAQGSRNLPERTRRPRRRPPRLRRIEIVRFFELRWNEIFVANLYVGSSLERSSFRNRDKISPSPQAGTMQLRKGSARVPRAIDGVSPSISLNHICSPFGDKICETKFAARRRKPHARG